MNHQRRSADKGLGPDGYGLLVSAATVPNRRSAAHLQALLVEWGIRATVTPAVDAGSDGCDVLVFGEDAHAACLVLTAMLPDPHDNGVAGAAEGQE